MKTEEAIKLLSNTDHLHEPPNGYYEALDMAIQALQNLSKPNNGLQGSDLISRHDAIKNAHFPVIDDAGYEVVRVDDILALPSAEPKTGKWIEVEDYNGDIHYQCDQCGEEFILIDGTPEDNKYWHCQNCGSYNREVREHDT